MYSSRIELITNETDMVLDRLAGHTQRGTIMADLTGQQLGNYRLIRLLGQGGFAEVYLGEHIHLNTQAAVKVLYTHLASEDLEKFRNEARTIARLEHPHIVRILDFGIEENVPFLIMSYGPNGTLRQRHPKGTQVPLDTVVGYVKQLAEALQYAHPEQLQGKPCPASDQYALGVVIYEWLSGDYPFHGFAMETAMQHMLTPPPPLHERIPTIPRVVEHVVLKALAKDPHKRFESVQAFADALEQANQGTTQFIIPSTPSPRIDVKPPAPTEEEIYQTVILASSPSVPTTPLWDATTGAHIFTYRDHTANVNTSACR